MIRLPEEQDPLLGRPFAVLDRILENGQPVGIEFGYHVVGKLTRQLPQLASGTQLTLWGPLGNGFPELQVDHLACVAGGIGYTPFVGVSKAALGISRYTKPCGNAYELSAQKVSFLYGGRNANACADVTIEAEENRFCLQYATEDGSQGTKGYVTKLLEDLLNSDAPPQAVFTCGPEVMMQAVAEICEQAGVDCWVSLETPMACGFGACFSCVTRIKQEDGSWDYRRSCVEGPVFPGHLMAWEG